MQTFEGEPCQWEGGGAEFGATGQGAEPPHDEGGGEAEDGILLDRLKRAVSAAREAFSRNQLDESQTRWEAAVRFADEISLGSDATTATAAVSIALS